MRNNNQSDTNNYTSESRITMMVEIIDEIRDAISGTLGDVFSIFVNVLFLGGVILFLVAAQNMFGKRRNIVWGIIYACFGFGLLAFSFMMGNPFGISFMGHGYTGISY